MTLTQWFPVKTKPVHVGLYQTKIVDWEYLGSGYSYWDGLAWSHEYDDAVQTLSNLACGPGEQDKTWRGITRGRGRPRKS